MPTLTKPYERKVYQKAAGGMSPRLQLQLSYPFGPAVVRRWHQHQEEIADRLRARIS
jgi:hypothetical protein